jgi:hypothetical protein
LILDLHIAAWTLIGGSALFFAGAAVPPEPSKVFTGDRSLYLDVLHRRTTRWRVMTVLMVSGVAATASGFTALGALVPQPLGIGATAFMIGSVLWIAALVSRATVDVDVAHAVARGEPVPPAFDMWQRVTGVFFKTYLLLAYGGVVLAGIAILSHPTLPSFAGWFAVVFGVVALLANTTGRPRSKSYGPYFEPPFMVHLPTLVMGIAFIGRHAVR